MDSLLSPNTYMVYSSVLVCAPPPQLLPAPVALPTLPTLWTGGDQFQAALPGDWNDTTELLEEMVDALAQAFGNLDLGGSEDQNSVCPVHGESAPISRRETSKTGQRPRAREVQASDAVRPAGDDSLSPEDEALAERIDEFLDATADGNAGSVNGPDGEPNPGLRGQGRLIVSLAREYDLPVELMLAQLQKESSFLSDPNNLSIANNNPGNLRFADWETEFGGKPDGPGNFTTFPSIEDGLRAYAHLLRNVYGDYIDRGDWEGMVYKYAPPFENDSALYVNQLIDWMADFRDQFDLS